MHLPEQAQGSQPNTITVKRKIKTVSALFLLPPVGEKHPAAPMGVPNTFKRGCHRRPCEAKGFCFPFLGANKCIHHAAKARDSLKTQTASFFLFFFEANPIVLQWVFPNTFPEQVQSICPGKKHPSKAERKREAEKRCRKANTGLFIVSPCQLDVFSMYSSYYDF